jgi:hypothetical protein
MGIASTVVSCTLALGIEKVANQTLYRFFPHWYKDVKYAYGVTDNPQCYESDMEKIATWSH